MNMSGSGRYLAIATLVLAPLVLMQLAKSPSQQALHESNMLMLSNKCSANDASEKCEWAKQVDWRCAATDSCVSFDDWKKSHVTKK